MRIEDLPEHLKKLALKRQLEENDFIYEGANLCIANDAFTWESTSEGNDFWYRVDQGLFTEARESLIGRSIKGFKFDESSTGLIYNSEMDKCIDRIGLIEEVDDGSIRVSFYDGADSWWYPMRQALDHLVPEGSIDQGTKELHRTLPDGKSDGIHEKPLTSEECVSVEGGGKQRVFETGSKSEFAKIAEQVARLLEYKNAKYGNSALNPINVFNGKSRVGQRADDKISRIQNSDKLKKNDVVDLMGYLILMCQENEWNTFDEFMD